MTGDDMEGCSDSLAAILDRIAQLGKISEEPEVLTRTFLSPAMREANEKVGQWMREAGMEVSHDDWGNIIGRRASANLGAQILLMGSHLDTVRNAGRYDGPLGVLLAIGVCAEMQRTGQHLPFHLDVIGFSDEEGVRFHSAYLGSKAVGGLLRAEDLKLTDAAGITLAEAVGHPASLPAPRYGAGELLGYLEAHIEQGPVLEAGGHALGVVTAIAAQSRSSCLFTGRAGHAGTTPMSARRDALAGAAEFISLVEKVGRKTPGLVATVGHLEASPNVSNVIAQQAVLSLDVRHEISSVVTSTLDELAWEGSAIAQARGLTFSLNRVQATASVACDVALTEALERAVRPHQAEVPRLVSGAGHDGVILSRLGPIAMLFIRCRNGLSHHPDEYVEREDIELALRALMNFVRELA